MRSLSSPTPITSFPQQHNTWHSPVPYLFGGLAAMLGLIAFALLTLACTYWRFSRYLDDEGDRNSFNVHEGKHAGGDVKPPPCFGEGFVVIMAGDQKPTFLATPIEISKATAVAGELQGGDQNQEN